MEFADEGGEGATPYEVLLHAAMVGDSTRFTRQDGVEETWRIMQPLLDAPPPVHAYAPGSWGPRRPAGRAGRPGHGRWHEPVDRTSMSAATSEAAQTAQQPQSAAAPSPFPPIADYAFLSNCHTGALDRARRRDRLALRAALRLARACSAACSTARPASSASGRSGSTTPRRASTSPGTNVLVTTWKTPSGWIVVRDALTMGPRDHDDEITPHTRPPADDDADHMLVRTVECLEGRVEVELVCEPAFDYGRTPGRVDARRRRPAHRRRDRRGPDDPPAVRPRARDRGQPRPGPARARGG